MDKKTALINKITPTVYPTTQIVTNQITVEEYVVSLATFFANELFDRRMPTEVLPLLAELAVELHKRGEIIR